MTEQPQQGEQPGVRMLPPWQLPWQTNLQVVPAGAVAGLQHNALVLQLESQVTRVQVWWEPASFQEFIDKCGPLIAQAKSGLIVPSGPITPPSSPVNGHGRAN